MVILPILWGGKMGFTGEYLHNIDGKGRVIVPVKYRDGLGDKFMVTKGLDKCLCAYPMAQWSELEKQLRNLSFTDPNARSFVRFFFSGATECELDKQGRILLPANLREYAKLDKDVVFAGISDWVEIWDKNAWDAYSEGMSQGSAYETHAEKLAVSMRA